MIEGKTKGIEAKDLSGISFSREEVIALHRLEKALPFLEMDTQSMRSLKAILLKNNPGGIMESALLFPETQKIHTTAQLIKLVVLSSSDPYVQEIEKIVKNQFPEAQKLSEISGRKGQYLLPVISEKYAWYLFPNIKDRACYVGGMNTSLIQGNGGQELGLIVASQSAHKKSGNTLEEFILHNTVHEMIHDTQGSQIDEIKGSTYLNDENGWNEHSKIELLEGLTDCLTELKVKKEGSPGYRANRRAVYSLLRKAGVEENAFEDRLYYLNSLPLDSAIEVLQDWLGGDFQEDFYNLLEAEETE